MDEQWCAIFETDQAYRAEILKDILTNNGVEAIILNQKDSAYVMLGTIKVMIRQSDRAKATEILKSVNGE